MRIYLNIYRNVNGEKYLAYVIFILLSLIGFLSCKGPSSGSEKHLSLSVPKADDEYLQEIGQAIGLDFVNSIGEEHLNNIIESVGGGAAFLDYDQDGFTDIYICNGTWIEGFSQGPKPDKLPFNHLYHNLGNGTYEDVTRKAGLDNPVFSMGVTVGDFNNDGYPDIYLSNYGPNVLYKNNGNGSFTDVTRKAGVAGGKDCSVGAVWFDYDNDGFLDIYVGNYLYYDPEYKYFYAPDGFPGPMAYDAQPDVLYHNNGEWSI